MSSSDSEDPKRRKVGKGTIVKDYEKLKQNIRSQYSEAHKGTAGTSIPRNIEELSRLYDAVQQLKTKDTTIHLKDSEVFHETTNVVAINARNLKIGDAGIALSTKGFLSKLKAYLGHPSHQSAGIDDDDEEDEDHDVIEPTNNTSEGVFNSYNWLKLGALYHSVSKKTPSIDFLNGPLSTQRKKPVARTRTIDDTQSLSSTTTAKQVNPVDISGDEQQNTAHMVRKIYETFVRKDQGDGINFFEFFINADSFTQSVENLFFASFLIKDARLRLYVEDGVPMIKRVHPSEVDEVRNRRLAETTHHIASLDYKTWQGLISRFGITGSFLGHRDEREDTFDDPEEE